MLITVVVDVVDAKERLFSLFATSAHIATVSRKAAVFEFVPVLFHLDDLFITMTVVPNSVLGLLLCGLRHY